LETQKPVTSPTARARTGVGAGPGSSCESMVSRLFEKRFEPAQIPQGGRRLGAEVSAGSQILRHISVLRRARKPRNVLVVNKTG
jgi:hypothetical protein